MGVRRTSAQGMPGVGNERSPTAPAEVLLSAVCVLALFPGMMSSGKKNPLPFKKIRLSRLVMHVSEKAGRVAEKC